jgi:hypothetical protein
MLGHIERAVILLVGRVFVELAVCCQPRFQSSLAILGRTPSVVFSTAEGLLEAGPPASALYHSRRHFHPLIHVALNRGVAKNKNILSYAKLSSTHKVSDYLQLLPCVFVVCCRLDINIL